MNHSEINKHQEIVNMIYNKTVYYHYDSAYEVESFLNWQQDRKLLAVLNDLFLAATIVITFIDFLLLFTVCFASIRQQSATWYMYHLNFLTILRVLFTLPRFEGTFHKSFGTCMFYSFLDWVITLLYDTTLVLMDIEIIATVFISSQKWKSCSRKRFFISMTCLWNTCLLASVLIMFFGYEEHSYFPTCFNKNKAAHVLGVVFKEKMPFIVSIIFSLTGIVFFIRTKRRPENYNQVTEVSNSVQTTNEWFACFMVWNGFVLLTTVCLFVVNSHFRDIGFAGMVVVQMTLSIIFIGLPLTCVFLEPVRNLCSERLITCIRSFTVSRRAREDIRTNQVPLEMEER